MKNKNLSFDLQKFAGNTQLSTPTLSVSNDVLTIDNIDSNANQILLKRNGQAYKTLYPINATYTNVSVPANTNTLIATDDTLTITCTPTSEYTLPSSISVVGASYTWNNSTGVLTLTNPTGPVSFSIVAYMVYSITPTLTNVSASASNPSFIVSGGTATLVFTANEGYNLPDSVSVSGATSQWTKATGTLVLSNPTGNVTFSVVGEAIASGYTVSWSSPYQLIEGTGFYSLDNGNTWVDFSTATSPLTQVTQIKFKSSLSSGSWETTSIESNTLGVSIGSSLKISDYPMTSLNCILLQNISDLTLVPMGVCIEENELLETPNGIVKAKDLRANDILYSVDNTNTIQWVKNYKSSDCYKLTLSNNDSVILTGAHICLTNELEQIRVNELKVGDILYRDLTLTNIEKLDEEYNVITIEVDGDHTYLVRNGFYTHNY